MWSILKINFFITYVYLINELEVLLFGNVFLMMMSLPCSCGRGWRSFRRSCWMMFMPSQWRRCRSWSSALVSSSKPPCRSPSTSLKKGRISYSSSGTAHRKKRRSVVVMTHLWRKQICMSCTVIAASSHWRLWY